MGDLNKHLHTKNTNARACSRCLAMAININPERTIACFGENRLHLQK